MKRIVSPVWCLLALLWLPVSAAAQADLPQARLVFGPLSLQPRVSLTNVGIDTNVRNTPTQPERDFTLTFIPGLDSRLRAGRTLFTAKTSAELLYFRKTREQRAISFSQEGRFEAPMARITPFVAGGHATTHQRPNAEIDERLEQTTVSYGLGATVRAGSRVRLTWAADRRRLAYGRASTSETAIARALDRASTMSQAAVSVDLTPLTTFTARAEFQQDRFEESPVRDTDSVAALAGFEMKPFALIAGTAVVGVRRFVPLDASVPEFNGLVAAVSLRYLARERTQFALSLNRNVDYSIEAQQPYYVTLEAALSVTQVIGTRWDAVGRIGRTRMDYQTVGASPTDGGRRDRQAMLGAGVGFRVNPVTRVGFDANYLRRLSPLASRHYDGFRFGGTFTYAY